MPIKFKCRTGEAYQVKVLAELLTNNLKTGCFRVSDSCITLRMFDNPRKTLVDLVLQAENFSIYKFRTPSEFCLGLNLNHFHKMLKSIKKKDSLQLFIDDQMPNELGIKTIPKENTRITTSGIKIQEIQNIEIDVPQGYGKPVIVPSAEFQKMCKDLSSIGSINISVMARDFYIEFTANADGILKRQVRFGENEDSDDDVPEENNPVYTATFTTDQLSRISKLSGLSSTMQIFPGSERLPFLFRSPVGSLGKISIYIKSQELIEAERCLLSSDSSDSSDSESQ
jgi:proliferating cell nuclear antigen PCNA